MEDIYSFEVYCTWSDTKYGINGAAANPVRVTIYDDFDQKKVKPLVVRLTPEYNPYYYDLKLRAFPSIQGGQIVWNKKAFSAPRYDDFYSVKSYSYNRG
mmetsp:Transcript_2830/g.2456  ORF Transcript_2830/g.2456 Transcript_2830/m.2456 type:complete len:99 (-) Transcript_2830:1829-2125(-)